jgi:hypothetical protein
MVLPPLPGGPPHRLSRRPLLPSPSHVAQHSSPHLALIHTQTNTPTSFPFPSVPPFFPQPRCDHGAAGPSGAPARLAPPQRSAWSPALWHGSAHPPGAARCTISLVRSQPDTDAQRPRRGVARVPAPRHARVASRAATRALVRRVPVRRVRRTTRTR